MRHLLVLGVAWPLADVEAAVKLSPARLRALKAAFEPFANFVRRLCPGIDLTVVERRQGISEIACDLLPRLSAVADRGNQPLAPAADARVTRALAWVLTASKEIATWIAAAPPLVDNGGRATAIRAALGGLTLLSPDRGVRPARGQRPGEHRHR